MIHIFILIFFLIKERIDRKRFFKSTALSNEQVEDFLKVSGSFFEGLLHDEQN